MGIDSKIEWTDASWNPFYGCFKVSAGCENCYALKSTARIEGMPKSKVAGTIKKMPSGKLNWTNEIVFVEDKLSLPKTWKKPKMIFVSSLSDLFHEKIPFSWIDSIFDVMVTANWHTYQILTKRIDRAVEYFNHRKENQPFSASAISHIWLGASVENQSAANSRIPALCDIRKITPFRILFLSIEPQLGPVDLENIQDKNLDEFSFNCLDQSSPRHVDWVICGGESGNNRRPFDTAWGYDLKRQGSYNKIAFFFKQVDKIIPVPERLKIQEFPYPKTRVASGSFFQMS